MTPYYVDPMVTLHQGDVRKVLRSLPAESVQMCVTSPPYWSLLYRVEGMAPKRAPGLKPKDLVGIPWMVAFALRADGWYLRQDIIWQKPNPMPESVSDRCTKAHEYLFLLSKSPRYYYDADAVREANTEGSLERYKPGEAIPQHRKLGGSDRANDSFLSGQVFEANGRNKRSVWSIPTAPFPEAHFATFPPDLVRPCVLAGTSEMGCCSECGAPWVREVERKTTPTQRVHNGVYDESSGFGKSGWLPGKQTTTTTGWSRSCAHDAPAVPCTVLDPFVGSGTSAMVAKQLGRRAIGIDMSAEYLAMAQKRIQAVTLPMFAGAAK